MRRLSALIPNVSQEKREIKRRRLCVCATKPSGFRSPAANLWAAGPARVGCTALVLLLTGCGKSAETTTSVPMPSDRAERGRDTLPALQVGADMDEVLVSINERTLTRADAEMEASMRAQGMQGQVPPEQLMGTVIEQFVVRTLLLDEAKKRGIEVTTEDEAMAYAKIEAALQREGRTLEEALRGSPLGEDRMREEVDVGIRIDKLLAQGVATGAPPTEVEIDQFIAENHDRLSMPELVDASHILITVDPEDTDAVKAEKRARAEAIREELLAGADFAEMARQHSEGPSSDNGGDLGRFPRGRMVPAFEEAAFSQEVDAIGPLVETQFGYHIIKVHSHVEAGQAPREEVVELLTRRNQSEALRQYVLKLMEAADITYADAIAPNIPPSIKP